MTKPGSGRDLEPEGDEEDGRAKLQASGSIDAPEVKELAANILEGGKEAFTRQNGDPGGYSEGWNASLSFSIAGVALAA